MPHDELLEIIDGATWLESWQALHAVVELHKPTKEGMCNCGSGDPYLDYEYPCPTIQAIEKELK